MKGSRISERVAGPAVARAALFSLGSVEEETVRLRSWAAIYGIVPSGTPFLRLQGDMTLVCLPTESTADPNPQTGVHAVSVEGGEVAVLSGVAFGDIRRVAEELVGELAIESQSLTIEFQRGTEGFGVGDLMIPIPESVRHPLAATGA